MKIINSFFKLKSSLSFDDLLTECITLHFFYYRKFCCFQMPLPGTTEKTEVKVTLGQEYVNATGFDDNTGTIYHKENANITLANVEKRFEVFLGIMESPVDFSNLLETLQISPKEMV